MARTRGYRFDAMHVCIRYRHNAPAERGRDLRELPLCTCARVLVGGERVLQHLQQRI